MCILPVVQTGNASLDPVHSMHVLLSSQERDQATRQSTEQGLRRIECIGVAAVWTDAEGRCPIVMEGDAALGEGILMILGTGTGVERSWRHLLGFLRYCCMQVEVYWRDATK
jgi:N-acetylglucosamine kinase-like BadF-type ATPase